MYKVHILVHVVLQPKILVYILLKNLKIGLCRAEKLEIDRSHQGLKSHRAEF
jgi:hypothetical protein